MARLFSALILIVSALTAIALEGFAVWAALRGNVVAALALHTSSASVVALSPGRTLVRGRGGWSLAFVLVLFLPVCGVVGVWVASLLGAAKPSELGKHLVCIRVPGAEEALVSARHFPRARARMPGHRDSVTTLRRALKDPDEDVRLTAHSILESKGRAGYRAVHEADSARRAASESDVATYELQLASRHFELVQLGLAEGDCLNAALEQARNYARVAVKKMPDDRSARFLLGRIQLKRGELADAEAQFTRAAQLGLPDAIVLPYLAEAAFLRGCPDLVRRQFASAPTHSNAVVERLRRYWA
jgi:Flp pilus assembly protein TadD